MNPDAAPVNVDTAVGPCGCPSEICVTGCDGATLLMSADDVATEDEAGGELATAAELVL
jgi:hypothetical protein